MRKRFYFKGGALPGGEACDPGDPVSGSTVDGRRNHSFIWLFLAPGAQLNDHGG